MNQNAVEVRKFAEELTQIQRSLYAYICAIVGCPVEAQDVLQETNRDVWERYEEYQPGTNLAAWVYKVAYFRVLTHRKQRSRRQQRFQETTMELLAQRAAETSELEEARQKALVRCVEKLTVGDRQLIQQRYWEGVDVESLAASLQRPANSLYRSLARIRGLLLECVQTQLKAEGLR